jgi:hypothetical protein
MTGESANAVSAENSRTRARTHIMQMKMKNPVKTISIGTYRSLSL